MSPASLSIRFPNRAQQWRLRTRTLEFGRRPLLMGIVNVTPDSFSDGGVFFEREAAVDCARRLAEEGADLLDIGGESTRPYSTPVDVAEELRRVMPVVEAVCRRVRIPVSIDTSKSAVARAAIDAGAEIINDVSGLTADPAMIDLAATTKVGVCAMHMRGTPQTMQDDPVYLNIVSEIFDYLKDRRHDLVAAGIEPERICLDPGIGFGKTHQHNLTLIANFWRYHELAAPLLAGHSRKAFIGRVLQDKHADRLHGTIGATQSLAAQGVQIIRVHDIRPVREALLLFEASGGIDGQEAIL